MLLAESAGRWLEPWGNPGPRGMTVIGSNPRNRTRLTGRLHIFIAQAMQSGSKSRSLRVVVPSQEVIAAKSGRLPAFLSKLASGYAKKQVSARLKAK